jgi:hypothetical protein
MQEPRRIERADAFNDHRVVAHAAADEIALTGERRLCHARAQWCEAATTAGPLFTGALELV